MSVDKKSFEAGYLLAVANIMHLHDEPVVAEDVLSELGISRRALRKFDLTDYDRDALVPLFQNLEHKAKWLSEREKNHG